MKESAGHMARRNLFTSGLEMERTEQSSRKTAMRESAERISLSKRVSAGVLLCFIIKRRIYLVTS